MRTSLSFLLFLNIFLDFIPAPPIAYATYWAFTIGRALVTRLYRIQALGVGLVGIGFVFNYVITAYGDSLPSSVSSSLLATALGVSFFYIISILTFFWIDASMRTARRADPLLRETFHWKQLRIVLWTIVIIATSTTAAFFIGGYLAGVTTNTGPPALPLFIFVLSPIWISAISGLIILPRAGRRAGDLTLRKHLGLFGLFAFFVLFHFILIFFVGGPINGILSALFAIIGSYFLYRSVRSLAPINRITPIEA